MQNKLNKNKKVLIALSGGIDSAVSAWLLKQQGYEVEAAFMKNWSSTAGLLKADCPWLEDRREALRVAGFLNIPFHTLDFEKPYQKKVMSYFFKEYQKGRTPNPDVMCNKEIKFGLLYNWARKNGFDFLATGHYAKIVQSSKFKVQSKDKNKKTEGVDFHLHRSADEFKDQTYFIYNIKNSQLPHVLFPVGNMKKSAVKKLAEKIGLPNTGRKESMGLCFVGKVRLKEFLKQKLKARPGNIKNSQGLVLGRHEGLQNFTIGQRQGIHLGGKGPFYVCGKDLKTNTLLVTQNPEDPGLFVSECQIHSVNWISETVFKKSKLKKVVFTGRYRHQGELVPLTIEPVKKDLYKIRFKYPQKAVVSGQSLVLYIGKECVGGGVIV